MKKLTVERHEGIAERKGGIPYCITSERAREEDYLSLRVAAS